MSEHFYTRPCEMFGTTLEIAGLDAIEDAMPVGALQSIDGTRLFDGHDKRGASMMRVMMRKTVCSCGQRAKTAHFSVFL